MADGLFDSSSSSSNSSSYHSTHYGSSSRSSGPMEVAILAIVLVCIVLIVIYNAVETAKERERDATVYPPIVKANFERWKGITQVEVKEGTSWFETGSSHRDNYHCKGGGFTDGRGGLVTVCCSVQELDPVPCLVL